MPESQGAVTTSLRDGSIQRREQGDAMWLPWDEWVRAYERAHSVSTIDNGHGPEQRELYHMSHGDAAWYIELIDLEDED